MTAAYLPTPYGYGFLKAGKNGFEPIEHREIKSAASAYTTFSLKPTEFGEQWLLAVELVAPLEIHEVRDLLQEWGAPV